MADIKTLSLACRVVMDMHALNNEGNESNRLMTRQVGIVRPVYDENGVTITYRRDVVNAISGDMNKHIFADAFRNVALDIGLPLNYYSQALDPARIMADPAFENWVTGGGDSKNKPEVNAVIDQLLACSLTDVCGIMITAGGQSIKRKSAVEFGWTLGLPEITQVEEFTHARHAINRLSRTKVTSTSSTEEKALAAAERESNLGQMIFTRPASSGVYAFVAHLDVAAIGFNDSTQEYPDHVTPFNASEQIPIDRAGRMRAALIALAHSVLHPKGALTSTQFPHVVDIEGFISTSTSAAAAPLISPLDDDFIYRASRTAELLNTLHGQQDAVHIRGFRGGEQLLEEITSIVTNNTPGQYVRY